MYKICHIIILCTYYKIYLGTKCVYFQINLTCKENDIDLSVKNILDEVQNLRGKLSTIETNFDYSEKVSITYNKYQMKNYLKNIYLFLKCY